MDIFGIIMAAGKGTRMKSLDTTKSKVAFDLLGVPLVGHVINALKPLHLQRTITIVGHGGETTAKVVEGRSEVVWQREQKGTGHAVMQVAPLLEGKQGTTLIVSGDTPLITSKSLDQLLKTHIEGGFDLTILTSIVPNPFGYGRMIRNSKGQVTAIVEEINASEPEKKIQEINTGFYVFNNNLLFKYLKELPPNPKNGEYNITFLIKMFMDKGFKIGASTVDTFEETLGINDRAQLAEARLIMQRRINHQHMVNGVTIENPDNTFISPQVIIGQDTVIQTGVYLIGDVKIGQANVIGANTSIENTTIGNHNHIESSKIIDSTIGDQNHIGPFAHIRGHSAIGNETRIGNFVEIKAAKLHRGVKAAHLSYLGDCEIGENTNIGAGTIVANYDGNKKHLTTVGKNVFVGSGTTLISPIIVEDETVIAAGSTITQNVQKGELAIARQRQENKPGYYKHWLKKIGK
ncbi:MAG: bifunctional UDP-N-acetylglucosamine diphosphorylase/glucosamine-1-phosphate N-acetyltransferase GlmU [Firmicutes bacterium]|nr:bifunctional UDP-N-acetylglucosamine diphosphorylase/glucosamine-1-phosphate N-acetyltransferase GlmU [Bacillota bacterium]